MEAIITTLMFFFKKRFYKLNVTQIQRLGLDMTDLLLTGSLNLDSNKFGS